MALLRVLHELARRIGNNGMFVSEEARVMGQAQKDALAAGSAAGGYGRPDGPTAAQVAGQVAGGAAGGTASSRANPDSQYYAMVCSHCQGRHWFTTVSTNPQVICPQCKKPTTFNQWRVTPGVNL